MRKYIINIVSVFAGLLVANTIFGQLPNGGNLTNNTYTLTDNQNITKECIIPENKNITINLNGKTLSTTSQIRFFRVNSGATLTINGPGIINGGTLPNTENGGAIFVFNGGNLVLNGCTIQNCTANNGGAIFKEGSSTVGTLPSGTVTLNEGTVIQNNKSFTAGGGIYCAANLIINGSSANPVIIQKNISETPSVFGTDANNNPTVTTKGQGGGIYIPYNSANPSTVLSCSINYCNIIDNYAAVNGGGILSGINTTVSNSNIKRNSAMSTESSSQSKSPNSGRGGGFYFTGYYRAADPAKNVTELIIAPQFNLNNTKVEENVSMWYGGGGQICSRGVLTLNSGSTIDKNICVLKGAAGLHITATATFNMNAGSISNNIAYGGVGGAIHSSYTCIMSLKGGIIDGNKVYGRGAGIHVNTGGELVLDGTDVTNNEAHNGVNLKYSTVSRNADGTYSFSTPQSGSNTAEEEFENQKTGYGGGILLDCGSCLMKKGNLSYNYAEKGGGGIGLVMINMSNAGYFKQGKIVSFAIEGGNVEYNKCGKKDSGTGDGAAIYLMKNKASEAWNLLTDADKQSLGGYNDPEVQAVINAIPFINMTGGSINNNTAEGNGGVAYLEESTSFSISGNSSVLSNNSSKRYGGAIYISQGTATIGGGKIENNTSVYHGGALYVNGNVTVTANADITGNTSESGNGGAIYVAGGNRFDINNNAVLTVKSNKANEGNGGALYCAGTFTVNGTLNLQNNSSINGGGVCVENGAVSLAAGKNSLITGNTATKLGGGLYVVNTTNGYKNATFSGGTFTGNTAQSGGAVCAQGKINLSLAATMESNTANNGTGGGMYLTGGVHMTFGDGLIRANQAKGLTAVSGESAFKKESISITNGGVSGVGGGIFMGNECTLTFESSEMGIYNNFATNAGADICANGNTTSITLPNITQMSLKGFDVPGNSLYWVEDYYNGDDNENTMSKKTGIRYETSLNDPNADILPYILQFGGNSSKVIEQYLCLDLGYDLVFVTLNVNGLRDKFDAVLTFSYPRRNDSGEFLANESYRKVLFTGSSSSTISRIIGLPSGMWKLQVSDWSYQYDEPTFNPSHTTQAGYEDTNDKYINITRTQNNVLNVNFKELEKVQVKDPQGNPVNINFKKIKQHQHRKVNRMVP